MNAINAIELRHVSRCFGDFALSDVSFELPSGCILGLMGENGAGKSTTLRLIMNTLRRDAGEIRVLGADNTGPAFREIKEDIGVVLDEAHFPEVLTVRELRRVLRPDGTLWLNIADTYCGTGSKGGCTDPKYPQGRNGQSVSVARKAAGCKQKDLIGIPWLLAFSLRSDGWYLRSDIL